MENTKNGKIELPSIRDDGSHNVAEFEWCSNYDINSETQSFSSLYEMIADVNDAEDFNFLEDKSKIDPWAMEQPSYTKYSLIKREYRKLKKFNEIANIAIVVGYMLYRENNYKRKKFSYYAEIIYDILDVKSIDSIVSKIKQIDGWIKTGKTNQISYGLMSACKKVAHLEPNRLLNILKNHQIFNVEEEIKKLINKDKQC